MGLAWWRRRGDNCTPGPVVRPTADSSCLRPFLAWRRKRTTAAAVPQSPRSLLLLLLLLRAAGFTATSFHISRLNFAPQSFRLKGRTRRRRRTRRPPRCSYRYTGFPLARFWGKIRRERRRCHQQQNRWYHIAQVCNFSAPGLLSGSFAAHARDTAVSFENGGIG